MFDYFFQRDPGSNISIKKVVIILLSVALCSCRGDDVTKYNKLPAQTLYDDAVCSLDDSFKDTIAKLDVIERRHPHYEKLEDARLLKIYTYYKHRKFDDAVFAADYFLNIYPASSNSPYAHYIRAMSYYDQIVDVGRDQQITEKARKDFTALIRRYPRTPYAKDSYWKLEYIFNILAAKEAEIGRFYLRQGNSLAAINRFKFVINQYDTSMLVPEALYRMAESCHAIGLNCQVRQYIEVLKYNFGDSKWYKQAEMLNMNLKTSGQQ